MFGFERFIIFPKILRALTMIRNKVAFLFFICFTTIGIGQNSNVLLSVVDEKVSTKEFMKLYNKNLDLVKDESQKELDNYLQLFIDYKLKLKEAKRLGFDEDATYKREFQNYKKQLTKNYINDNEVTDAIVKEAYDRSLYDVKASHILILNDPQVEDTLVAYNQLLEYRKVLENEGFEGAKSKYHDGKKVLVEDLGYFSVFKMVYDFESMAYNTKPGEVSMPFKTQFGYHVVRIDEKRPSKGKVTVAHIMVSNKQKDTTLNIKERIDDVYKKVLKGESFDALAKQFSDDKSSARVGGKLRPFKSGNLSSIEFENAAFGLENVGDITKPIKSDFGWHIIKLLKKEPVLPYEEMKSTLENQVKRDARSKLINSVMVKKLEIQYAIEKNTQAKQYFRPILEDGYLAGKFELPKEYNGTVPVVKVNDVTFTNNDFLQHLKAVQRKYMRQKMSVKNILDAEFQTFYENSVLKFREENLVNENEEFSDILDEYKNGLLLFTLMEKEIWNKASKDSLGLKNYYNENSDNYTWEERIKATIISTKSEKDAKRIRLLINASDSIESLEKQLKENNVDKYIFTNGVFERSNIKIPSNLEFKQGVSEIYEHNESFHVYVIDEVMPSGQKTFKEARGSIVNDFQNKFEKDWLQDLRNRFNVTINEKVFEELKKQLGQ